MDNSALIISGFSFPPSSFRSRMSFPSSCSLFSPHQTGLHLTPLPPPSPSLLSSLTDPCSPPVTGRCVSTCQAPWQPHICTPNPSPPERRPPAHPERCYGILAPTPNHLSSTTLISPETSAKSLTKSLFSFLQTSHPSLLLLLFISEVLFFPPHKLLKIPSPHLTFCSFLHFFLLGSSS